MNKSRDKVDEGVTEDDINEIKQDISSFRYELLEILGNNGMEIPDYSRRHSAKLGSKRHKRRDIGRTMSFGFCVTQKNPKPKLSILTQHDSVGSSIDESLGEPSEKLGAPADTLHSQHENQHHHHNRLARSKLGQIVMKKFHKHKSREIDDDEEVVGVSIEKLNDGGDSPPRTVSFSLSTPTKSNRPLSSHATVPLLSTKNNSSE